jgi:hypothetical protein
VLYFLLVVRLVLESKLFIIIMADHESWCKVKLKDCHY